MKENYFEEHVNKFTNYKIIFYFNLLGISSHFSIVLPGVGSG